VALVIVFSGGEQVSVVSESNVQKWAMLNAIGHEKA